RRSRPAWARRRRALRPRRARHARLRAALNGRAAGLAAPPRLAGCARGGSADGSDRARSSSRPPRVGDGSLEAFLADAHALGAELLAEGAHDLVETLERVPCPEPRRVESIGERPRSVGVFAPLAGSQL